tara:strand:+ start:1614 stop:1922 length:309 start_codon:yes stop_codon:yes gene_type:complete
MPLDSKGKAVLYKPWVNKSDSKSKYWVYVKSDNKKGFKKIGFGLKGMGQYKDKGKYYKSLDHGDPVRRKSYLSRAKGIKNKKGELTYKDKNSANYWAINYLW